ncbi:hypothetical protein LTR48_001438 [Friedmanniomyces endolithicus]|uniref:Uncharacterized protein n=1 Tax=Rachicladosporium monterosium TaxID=1507873 RepID=A0ABR0L4S9_9PEZI|nr:hypothetical protein LTR48_001438 [Friedmanniomyces endolithicus]KAK5143466.1 hypothetical protein LTR32_004410 [Rachicladosporium monterosium]
MLKRLQADDAALEALREATLASGDSTAWTHAENAWKSLERQVANQHAAEPKTSPATKLNDKPFVILDHTEEVSAACEEFAKTLQAWPLADLLGISEDDVRRRLKRGKSVHFLPIAGEPVKWIHSAPGRIVGTLAFSVLRNSQVMRHSEAAHVEL